MKKLKYLVLCSLFFITSFANADNTTPAPIIRKSVFSTSTDWESVTDLRLSEYNVGFSEDKKLIGNGLELYFLDGFPCYGQTYSARIWIGDNGKKDGEIRITCLFAPKNLSFAWRNVDRDARQDKTTGILECPVIGDNDLKIDLSKCKIGKEWKEYR